MIIHYLTLSDVYNDNSLFNRPLSYIRKSNILKNNIGRMSTITYTMFNIPKSTN